MTDTFRCAGASEADDEPIAGTAPTEAEWLLVEQPGAWAAKATGHLAGLVGPGGRAQLIRRPDGRSGGAVRVFRAVAGGPVRTAVVGHVDEVAALGEADLTAYDGPLWLVCTNGRRDVCCAERGRPVAAALAARWPEATWETTHLGGHRFAATLLALPSGVALGRLDPAGALAAAEDLLAGELPLAVVRGRAGQPAAAQAAELAVRRRHGWTGLDQVRPLGVDADVVTLATPEGERRVRVTAQPGTPRRQSCADDALKATPTWVVAALH